MGRKTSVYLAADLDSALRASGRDIPALLREALGITPPADRVAELAERLSRVEAFIEDLKDGRYG